MRPKSMILIVIALACGLVASIGISQVMENRSADAPVVAPMEKIFVAAADVPLGQALEAKMVKEEEWPKDKIPEGAVRKLTDIEGKKPLTRLYPGEPILAAKLIDANKFFGASEKIPKGFRVASVKVTMDSSASGLINPGDKVDVLVYLKKGRGVSMTGTRTILKNVTVFAVNDRFQRDAEEDAEGLRAKTVSLLVKPNQVEKVMLASELGRIKLSLRGAEDETEDSADGATVADLDAGSSHENGNFSIAAATGEGSKSPPAGGITDFLRGMKAIGAGAADTSSKEAWVMRIHTPSDIQVYNWDDRESLPRELLASPDPVVPAAGLTGQAGATEPAAVDSAGGGDFSEFTPADSPEIDASDDVTSTDSTDVTLD